MICSEKDAMGGRAFPIEHRGRLLSVQVLPVDEAWQLWVCEQDRRLVLGATVPLDAAIEGWRRGEDVVARMVDQIRERLANGDLSLTGTDPAAERPTPDKRLASTRS
jgi:hypothetical protein